MALSIKQTSTSLLFLVGLITLSQTGVFSGARPAHMPRLVSGRPVRFVPAGRVPPPTPDAALRFVLLGDTGRGDESQHAVAAHARRTRPDCVLLLGDNFYPDGVVSIDDPQWDSAFQDVYPLDPLDMEFCAILGNHDHNGNIQAQVEYAGAGVCRAATGLVVGRLRELLRIAD